MRDHVTWNRHKSLLADLHWLNRQYHARHGYLWDRYMEPTVEAFLPSKSPANAAALSSYGEENMATATQLIVYMPYLHWDYYKSMLSRTRLIKDKIARVGKKSNAENAFTSPGMEQKVLHQYVKCGNDWSIHPRRSLDQYGYPTLANTNVRNADQVMYKAPKVKGIQGIEDDLRPPARMRLRDARNKPPKRRKDSKRDRSENVEAADYDEKAKVLMVDQCWLWVLDHNTVLTCFPSMEDTRTGATAPQADIRHAIEKAINSNPPSSSTVYRTVTSKCLGSCRITSAILRSIR